MTYWVGSTKYEPVTNDFIDEGLTLYSMAWTSEPPTQEGWYWVKREDKREIVQVYKLDGNFYAWTTTDERDHNLNEFIMWIGPLPEPEIPTEDS